MTWEEMDRVHKRKEKWGEIDMRQNNQVLLWKCVFHFMCMQLGLVSCSAAVLWFKWSVKWWLLLCHVVGCQ